MFTRTEATHQASKTHTQLPPATTEEWEQPTMICASSPDAQEQICLVKASARDFVFVLR